MNGGPPDLLRRVRPALSAVAGFSLAINILMLTTSVYMMQVFDRVLASQSLSTLFYLSLMAGSAIVVIGILELIRSRILVRVGIWMDQALAGTVLSRSLENAVRGNGYRSQALRDLGGLRNFLGGGGVLALFDAPWVPVYLAIVYLLHPWLGHVSLAGAVLLLTCAMLNHRLTARPLKTANAEHAKAFARVDAAFRNAEVIDSMAMAPALVNAWGRLNRKVLHLQEEASDRASLVTALGKFIRLMLQIAILATGAVLVVWQEISAGGMVAASLIMSRALSRWNSPSGCGSTRSRRARAGRACAAWSRRRRSTRITCRCRARADTSAWRP